MRRQRSLIALLLLVIVQDPHARGVQVIELTGADGAYEDHDGDAREHQRQRQHDVEHFHDQKLLARYEWTITVRELSGINTAATSGSRRLR